MANRNTIVGLDFLVFGIVVSSLGYIVVQSVPIAAFGFAFATIGALILLIVPESVPHDTYKSMVPDSIANVEVILEESSAREKAYFLPIKPEKIRGGDSSKKEVSVGAEIRAFVPIISPRQREESRGSRNEKRRISFPVLAAIANEAPKRFIMDYNGVQGLLLVPPGSGLVRLAKLQEGDDIEESLQTVLVESSELAKSVISIEEERGQEALRESEERREVEDAFPRSSENKIVKLQISRPTVLSTSPYFADCLGSPVSCVSCCVLAAVTGKPVRIVNEKFDSAILRLAVEIISN